MSTEKRCIVGIGELLWDLLPGGKQLGGAASNFSVMAARLGNRGVIASAIGDDELGLEALSVLAQMPVDTSQLQRGREHATGSVSVTLRNGQPEYGIHENVAWDFLELTPAWTKLAYEADAVCFNTLAQRSPKSRETVRAFLAATSPPCLRVLDVNLRAPFYDAETLHESLSFATLVKLNDAEMPVICEMLRFSGYDSLLTGARLLLRQYEGLKLICITLGSEGSLLVTREAQHRHPGFPVDVVDTVGAGDAFTAALVHYYLKGAPLAMLNEAGNRWGSWVASQKGAMPPLSDEVRDRIFAQIQEQGSWH